MSSSLEFVDFGISTSPEVAAAFGVTAPAVVLFKQFDEGRLDYSGTIKAENLVSYILANGIPEITKVNSEVQGGEGRG